MRYIKSIEIENFQSHKHTKLDFINGLNVISGPSDNGKTAIIRALKWVLYNEPKGSDFIRQGENYCRVSVTLDDDTVIIREKSKSKNIYILRYSDKPDIRFEGFGNDIPEDIIKAHGIRKVYIDEKSVESINIAEQLQGPFLLSESGSIKAKAIGKLVGVHYLDGAIKLVDKDINLNETERKKTADAIEEINIKLEDYKDLEQELNKLKKKEQFLNRVNELNSKLKKIMNIKESLDTIHKEMEYHNQLLSYLKSTEDNLVKVVLAFTKNESLKSMYNNKIKLYNIEQEIAHQYDILKNTHNVEKLNDSYLIASNFLTKMKILKEKYILYNNCLSESSIIKKLLISLVNIESANKNSIVLENKTNVLRNLQDKFKEFNLINSKISIGNEYLLNFKHLDEGQSKLDELNKKKELYAIINELKLKLISLNNDISNEKKNVIENNEKVKRYVDEYANYLKRLGKCPVCLSEINEDKLEHVLSELKGDDIDE